MSNDALTGLAAEWLMAKNDERRAAERRRAVEDELAAAMRVDDGTTTAETPGGYTITATTRINRKIDSSLLQEVAAENGMSDALGRLFRWKPEINAAAWQAAPENITAALSQAVTETPGRASFKITYTPQQTEESHDG